MKLRLLGFLCFLCVFISSFYGCEEVIESNRNPDLVAAMVQCKNIRSELNYYWIDNKVFPRDLIDLDIGRKYSENAIKHPIIDWIYETSDDRKMCILRTEYGIGGYFVFLSDKGEVVVESNLPNEEKMQWRYE